MLQKFQEKNLSGDAFVHQLTMFREILAAIKFGMFMNFMKIWTKTELHCVDRITDACQCTYSQEFIIYELLIFCMYNTLRILDVVPSTTLYVWLCCHLSAEFLLFCHRYVYTAIMYFIVLSFICYVVYVTMLSLKQLWVSCGYID